MFMCHTDAVNKEIMGVVNVHKDTNQHLIQFNCLQTLYRSPHVLTGRDRAGQRRGTNLGVFAYLVFLLAVERLVRIKDNLYVITLFTR